MSLVHKGFDTLLKELFAAMPSVHNNDYINSFEYCHWADDNFNINVSFMNGAVRVVYESNLIQDENGKSHAETHISFTQIEFENAGLLDMIADVVNIQRHLITKFLLEQETKKTEI